MSLELLFRKHVHGAISYSVQCTLQQRRKPYKYIQLDYWEEGPPILISSILLEQGLTYPSLFQQQWLKTGN